MTHVIACMTCGQPPPPSGTVCLCLSELTTISFPGTDRHPPLEQSGWPELTTVGGCGLTTGTEIGTVWEVTGRAYYGWCG